MERWITILIRLAAAAAVIRGFAAFDAGGSAASNYPTASAILFVGGLMVLAQLRESRAS